jgi:hypothetical protein
MSLFVEKYNLKANVCSHIIRTRVQYNSGDELMDDDQTVRKIIMEINDLMKKGSKEELIIYLNLLKKTVKNFT